MNVVWSLRDRMFLSIFCGIILYSNLTFMFLYYTLSLKCNLSVVSGCFGVKKSLMFCLCVTNWLNVIGIFNNVVAMRDGRSDISNNKYEYLNCGGKFSPTTYKVKKKKFEDFDQIRCLLYVKRTTGTELCALEKNLENCYMDNSLFRYIDNIKLCQVVKLCLDAYDKKKIGNYNKAEKWLKICILNTGINPDLDLDFSDKAFVKDYDKTDYHYSEDKPEIHKRCYRCMKICANLYEKYEDKKISDILPIVNFIIVQQRLGRLH